MIIIIYYWRSIHSEALSASKKHRQKHITHRGREKKSCTIVVVVAKLINLIRSRMYHTTYQVPRRYNQQQQPTNTSNDVFFFGIIIIARKKKSKRFRTTECATIVQKKTKRARASGGRQKFKRRTLYRLSYGG